MTTSANPEASFFSTGSTPLENVSSTATVLVATQQMEAISIHWTAVGIEAIIIIIGALLTTCCYFTCFKKRLGADGASGGPTAIHLLHGAAYEGQEKAFLAEGGAANQLRAEQKHSQNMALIAKVVGEEKTRELQETLSKNNLEIDPALLDRGIKEGGPEVMKLMVLKRMTMEEAVQKVAEQRAAEELAKHPELLAEGVSLTPQAAPQ